MKTFFSDREETYLFESWYNYW